MSYINHDHPVVKNIMAAQAILRPLMRDAYQESYQLPRAADRLKARKARTTLDNAMVHLSEEIRQTPACWIEGGVL